MEKTSCRALGIELGSTRIKAVLIDADAKVLASGSFEWENVLTDGYWSYPLESVDQGLQASFAALAADYRQKFGEPLTTVDAVGVSAMMHGYLAFDKNDRLLVPFRTWRNTSAGEASRELSALLGFHIPQRWSVSHYYQAVLNKEPHVKDVAHLTTLAGYVHTRLTGRRVLGLGDASGVFPLKDGAYDPDMLARFEARLAEHGVTGDFRALLPDILPAGAEAGRLTEAGARLLDPTGTLQPGALCCPPEGDAGTGMVATNSITPRTANVSAGTSGFLMAVLERPLSAPYPEIDIVTTPAGAPVAMIHVNNFTSELTTWANLFEEVIAIGGGSIPRGKLYDALYAKALEGEDDCGGLLLYNFAAGEPIAGVGVGVPMLCRAPGGRLTLANFMRAQIYAMLGGLAMGMEILRREKVALDAVCGHGGFFKAPLVGQRAMSAALGAPVTVLENAGEGGPWGMALLALFAARGGGDLTAFLDAQFAGTARSTISADAAEQARFDHFLSVFRAGLATEHAAADIFRS